MAKSTNGIRESNRTKYGLSRISGTNIARFSRHTVVLQNLIEHGRFDPGMDAGHSHVATVRIDRKRISAIAGRIGDHSVIQTQQSAATRQEMPCAFE